jgi:hypothetical protein
MAKKKKFTYTANDVDQASADGFLEGMAETHGIVFDAINELQQSVENVQSIYYIGNVVGDKNVRVQELQAVFDSLTHLKDVFQANYDEVMDEHIHISNRLKAIQSFSDTDFKL